jgi:hypothetical protein
LGKIFSGNPKINPRYFRFLLDYHVFTWYTVFIRKEVIPLRDFIREMTEVARELNKLFDQLIKLTWKISSLAGVILFIIYSLTK